MGVSIWYELSPYGLKIIGSPVVLQTLRMIVVLPALARPITRIRNCLNFFRISLARSAVTWGFDEVDISKDVNRCERFKLGVITLLQCIVTVTFTASPRLHQLEVGFRNAHS